MRILYLFDQKVEEGRTSGIITKIKEKTAVWRGLGHEVQYLSLYSMTLYDSEWKPQPTAFSFALKRHSRLTTLFRLLYSSARLSAVLKTLDFDVIYMRTRLYMPLIGRALKGRKVIMELNSDDLSEFQAISPVHYYYNLLTRDWFYGLASGFVAVSEELAERFKKYKRPMTVIANGIDVQKYPFIGDTGNDVPNLVFIGSPGMPWHGLDKVRWLAEQNPQWKFHIVGEGGQDTPNVKFYGYVSLEQSKEIVSRCDVGLGTLALYRKSMTEASPLKARQYLAQGVPLVYGYEDTDFRARSGLEAFTLRVPNEEHWDGRVLDQIRGFVRGVCRSSICRSQARQFAQTNLDVGMKEKVRFEFISRVLQ